MDNLFTNKYRAYILGTNSFFDRIIVTGSLIPIAYLRGLNTFLSANHILLKDFLSYAKNLAETLKDQAKLLSEKEGAPYIYLNHSKMNKEKFIKTIITERGDHPGLVAVISVLELDNSFDIYRNKVTKMLELISRKRKGLHIYYYFIDKTLGLCHFRIQTFFPFKVQIYFNGKEQLARKMDGAGIAYQKEDNCFTWINDPPKAQQLADDLDVSKLQILFDQWAERFVSILGQLQGKWNLSYHWSIRQIEYAQDILFKSQERLDSLYHQLLQ